MVGTPNTIGLVLLLIVVFLACILWATGGHTADADPEEEDVQTPGKTT
ncbi:MAG TPA: hypothetical protein VIY53_05055 [Acidobacteriaceae bacterium]